MAHQSTALPVLLGRSGRFTKPPSTGTLDGSVPLMALRCDAAVAEESRAALARSGVASTGSLAAIMHAGGILQDAMLPQQTAATVRATSAPKLRFMTHVLVPAQLHATQAVNLFSSVAAFIGSPGQANYAAANIALDCWSTALQQRGAVGEQAKGIQAAPGFSFVFLRFASGFALLSPAKRTCRQ